MFFFLTRHKMSSTQQGIFPWYTIERETPSVQEYIPVSYEQDSSYEHLALRELEYDMDVIETIKKTVSNDFVKLYAAFPYMFSSTDRYTLFIPMNCDTITKAANQWNSPGNSYQDRQLRTEAYSAIERILKQHMVSYRIEPSQVIGQQVTIESNNTIFSVDEGQINQTENKILSHLQFPNATVFFISSEIESYLFGLI